MTRLSKTKNRIMSAAVVSFLCLLLGCAQRAPEPQDTLEAYRDAVLDGDASAVYALLDESARMGMDEEAFADYFRENSAAISDQSAALIERASAGGLDVEAQVPVEGFVAPVVFFEGRWFLAREEPTRSRQDTPRDTLDALFRMLSSRDLEGVVGLLSDERRTVYVQELDVLRDILSQSIDNVIVTDGDAAVLPLENGDRVLLVREDGVWKLQGYEQSED